MSNKDINIKDKQMGKQMFGIVDGEEFLEGSDVFMSMKEVLSYAQDTVEDYDDDLSLTIVQLTPIYRVKKTTDVITEKLDG